MNPEKALSQPERADTPVKPCRCSAIVSVVTGVLSFLCLPLILGIIAIVTGLLGRRRAQQEKASKTLATVGLWLGIVNVVISLVLGTYVVIAAMNVFNNASNAVTTVRALGPAIVAVESYGKVNGSFTNLSTEALSAYGYLPPDGVSVEAVARNDGAEFCIQASADDDPQSAVHVTGATFDESEGESMKDPTPQAAADAAKNAVDNINLGAYSFKKGECPVN